MRGASVEAPFEVSCGVLEATSLSSTGYLSFTPRNPGDEVSAVPKCRANQDLRLPPDNSMLCLYSSRACPQCLTGAATRNSKVPHYNDLH
jgi:hypothetical protein